MSKTTKTYGILDLAVMALSLYVLVAFIADAFFDLRPELRHLLHLLDNIICIVFFVDFCWEFFRSKNKKHYMRWGWINLLACIPVVRVSGFEWVLRAFRLLRVFNIFRVKKRLVTRSLFRDKANSAMASAAAFTILLIIFSSISILIFEIDSHSNINTAEDAVWWTFVSITSTGYGDMYPVTTAGRIIGIIVMTCGTLFFGVFMGFVASRLIGNKKEIVHSGKEAEQISETSDRRDA